MLSKRPYLLLAWYNWICDANLTPYIAIDATLSQVVVPSSHIVDGKITLNISPSATENFCIHYLKERPHIAYALEFEVGFSTRDNTLNVEWIYIPIKAVQAIYAAENQQGIFFSPEEDEIFLEPKKISASASSNTKLPPLTIVE
jgi:stringent starvation protein B